MAENILAVEDERHVVLDCGAYATDRQKMWDARELVNGGTDPTARETRFREVLGDYTLRQVDQEERDQLTKISMEFTGKAMKKRSKYRDMWY